MVCTVVSSHFTVARLTCHIMAFDCGRALAASDDLRSGRSERRRLSGKRKKRCKVTKSFVKEVLSTAI